LKIELIITGSFRNCKKINLENPIIKIQINQMVVNEPEALFYKGTKVLSENYYINKKLLKLENDQFNYNPILDKGILFLKLNNFFICFFAIGLFIGFFLSLYNYFF
jgi:hypothetical protein